MYMVVMGQALLQKLEETNTYIRIQKMQPPPNSEETFMGMKDNLTFFFEFLSRLRLEAQVHYKDSYHKVLGLQILKRELKGYKSKFTETDISSRGFSKANLQWLNKTLFNIKSQVMENPDSLPVRVTNKISKLWKSVFGTELVEIKEDTISKIETQLKELDSVADTSKYYIASEKMGTVTEKSKPRTVAEIEVMRKRLGKTKMMLKEVWEEFYVDASYNPPAIQAMEKDLAELRTEIDDSKSLAEHNPLILKQRDVGKLNEAISFLKNILPYLQSLA